jgi:glutamate synthase (NADPH/NADH) large chain
VQLEKVLVLGVELVDVVGLDETDLAWLEQIVRRHQELTNSLRAGDVLVNWQVAKTKMRKVLPRDYARVIAEIEKAKLEKVKVTANG